VIVGSAPEPFVIVRDGAQSQLLGLAGRTFLRRAGLPWSYTGSRFASDGESVARIEDGVAHGDVDGLQLTGRRSFGYARAAGARFSAFAIVGGRFLAAWGSIFGAHLFHADIADLSRAGTWPAGTRETYPMVEPATFLVDDGDRILAVSPANERSRTTWHSVLVMSPGCKDFARAEIHSLPMSMPNETLAGLSIAGEHVVVHGASKVADSIALYDRRSLACSLRVVRDAVIPRFVSATVVDDVLVVVDDRPGVMSAPIERLQREFANARSFDEGARAAASLLRSTWCESPIGTIRELRVIPGSHDVIALLDDDEAPVVCWSPLATQPTRSTSATRRSYSGDRWT
jgi:hypothetical protein